MHRDVKPANVLLSTTDHVYLTDFGLSKRSLADDDATHSGTLLGTLNYVAPEQIRGAELGPATDIYALGCVLFQLLTGEGAVSDRHGGGEAVGAPVDAATHPEQRLRGRSRRRSTTWSSGR